MKDMKVTRFANVVGTPSGLANQLDVVASSQDVWFAEAIVANEPTSILEEAGIIVTQNVPDGVDIARFPIVRNTQFTWYEIDGRNTTNSLGSELGVTGLNRVEYRQVRPTIKTASIFLPDEVSLLNKVSFDLYAKVGATEAKRKKEADALGSLTSESLVGTTRVYDTAFSALGSVGTGSTLNPTVLLSAKRLMWTGSDREVPNFVLMHPIQYQQLNTHFDFAPAAVLNGAMMRKAQYNDDGDIMRFDGMDVYVSELLPQVGSTSLGAAITNDAYKVVGHPVVVGVKGKCLARGQHKNIVVSTQDSRLHHGQWKIFDMSYAHDVLVQEAILLIRCSDA